MYGQPEESKRPTRTVALDLPREIEFVTDPQGDSPPIKAFGPLAADEARDEGPERTPIDVDLDGTVAEFTFADPLEEGRYWIAVYQSRFEAKDGEPYELTENGTPFTGWELQVLNASPRHTAEGREQETRVRQRSGPRLEKVLVDGEPAPDYQLSGEMLTVVTSEQADVTLALRPLLKNARHTLYEKYATKIEHEVDGKPATSFASVGPIGDFQWATFNGADTTGRLPLNDFGRIAWGAPVMREPAPAKTDPLIGGTANNRVDPNTNEDAYLEPEPLGDISGGEVGYGFTSLDPNYSGPVIEARRGDGVHDPVETKDFTAQEISDGDLADWADEAEAVYLRTFYDQSGNGRDAQQTDLDLQPEILGIGGDLPYIHREGARFLQAELSGVTDYTALVVGGADDATGEPALFDLGNDGDREVYRVDTDGQWVHDDIDHLTDPVPYSEPGQLGRYVHVIRRKADTLEAQLATGEETEATVEAAGSGLDDLILGRAAGSDDGSTKLETFVLWSKRITDDQRDNQVTAPKNVYTEYAPLVTPQSPDSSLDQYDGPSALWPEDIYNEDNTPATNPRLFPDATYFDEEKASDWSPRDEKIAVFDLPLHHEVVIEVDGREVWSAQTRLVPVFVTIPQIRRELGWDVEDKAGVIRDAWHASMEALQLWGCKPPTTGPTASMQEFVLSYLAEPPQRTSGAQGRTRSRMGDQSVDTQSDRKSRRRLSELASLLDDCEASTPLFPEDQTPTAAAGVGENAADEYYKPRPTGDLAREVAPLARPLYWGNRPRYRSEYHRLDL